jgi:DNA-binding NtrC family response regulator
MRDDHDAAPGRPAELATREAGDRAVLLAPAFTLTVLAGDDRGRSFRATAERTTIGTHASADLALSDASVSRLHCALVSDDGRVVVRDLGSKNGTELDGVRVVEAFVRAGSRLRVGTTTIGVDIAAAPMELALDARAGFELLVGASKAMRRIYGTLQRAAESDATVLLTGETGTGKEVAAESIHRASARATKPFVVVDCGALPADILESELFGHERGAFTGAQSARAGLFEIASGGTVFLDEIGELPIELQPKLLGVLERRVVRRVGGNKTTPIDVRVVAATHRDLAAEVNAKRFRSDLYYRLAVIDVRLPALRERSDDIAPLIAHVLGALGVDDGETRARLTSPEVLEELARHRWPGNVRELRNYVERCIALRATAPLDALAAQSATADVDVSRPLRVARDSWNAALERQYLLAILDRNEGNVAAAARAAGIGRVYFYRLLWKYGIRDKDTDGE